MCIIATKPKGIFISKETAKNCFDNNPDGAGFMFSNDDRLFIRKGFFDFNRFWASYTQAMIKYDNPTSILHFRITTHGLTDKSNCHPFRVNDNLGFAHNGIIHFVDTDKKCSDTSMFNKTILRRLPPYFYKNDSILQLIAESIGTNSKLSFLDNKGDYVIVNESAGNWKEDIWYSNDTYESCSIGFGGYGGYGGYGYTYFPINKKKKKNKKIHSGVVRFECQSCNKKLTTIYEQNNGLCGTCDYEYTL